MKDLISKADVLETYAELYDRFEDNQFIRKELNKVYDKLNGLPYAQPEPCEDAVSREAVSSWLKQYGQDVLHGKYKFSLMYIWKNLMDLPSAQPETDCAFKEFGNCSYSETGCSDCKVKAKIRNALSVQPEPYGDVVSRADVFDMLDMYPFTEYGEYETAREIVKRLPSVTPKRKKGKWLDNYQYGYKCSECGAYLEIDCGDVEMNFCPNCNADMRGKQDE